MLIAEDDFLSALIKVEVIVINDIDRVKIIKAMELVLNDSNFLAAPKSSAFLRYIVLQTLDGNAHQIKAYSIAVDALQKPTTFDPQDDPSVRVMAKRIRDMLNDYYNRTTDHEVILQLKAGNYVPQFIMPISDEQSDNNQKLLE